MIRRIWTYIDPRPGDDAGAGDAGAGAGAGGEGAGDAGSGGDGAGLLTGDAGAAGGGDAGGTLEIPEKFRVFGADGTTVDHAGTLQKVLGSYAHLEKRVGSGDLPPKSADEYTLDRFLPEGMESDPEKMKPLLGEMHKLGLTQKQVQGVMNLYGTALGTAKAAEKQSYDDAVAKLQEKWGTEFDANLQRANLVVNAFGSPEERAAFRSAKYTNDPVLVEFLAKIGAELGEDRLPGAMTDTETDDIDALRTSEAYTNPRHPDHKRIVAKVNQAYQKGYKGK